LVFEVFPTIKFFRNGVPSDYEGGRVATEIASWVKRKSGPATVRINTIPELESFQENNEVFIIGVFFSTDSPAAKVFEEVAGSDDSNVYGSSTTVEIQQKLGVTGDAIVVLKKFDELRNDLVVDDKLTTESLKSFIASTSSPLIQEFSPERSKKIFSSDIKVIYIY
jgi:protein disulfide-isomerase A1